MSFVWVVTETERAEGGASFQTLGVFSTPEAGMGVVNNLLAERGELVPRGPYGVWQCNDNQRLIYTRLVEFSVTRHEVQESVSWTHETHTFRVEAGFLQEVPVYESHRRGHNWLAVIKRDETSAGGLGRVFCQRSHDLENGYYLVSSLRVGDPVEFGADYRSGSGYRRNLRWYGVVTAVHDDRLEVVQTHTAVQALKLSVQRRAV